MSMEPANRAQTLQGWMDEHQLNDRQLAEKLGKVTRSQVCRIRRGARTSPDTAQVLERVTGIPATNFIFPPSAASSPPQASA